nr:vegetative cell wall protein gp1 [Ipomoea batatas]
MSWLGITFLLCFVLNGFTEARHYPAAAVLVGTVYCDTCFHRDFSEASHFISGSSSLQYCDNLFAKMAYLVCASVAVECGHSRNGPSFRKEVKTDDHGEFRVHLPFSVSKHVKKIKGCYVKLINSSEPFCAVASSATSSSIHLKERKEGKHIFSAGFFTFKPLNQPELCNQKPSIHGGFKKINGADSPITDPNNPAFLPPIRDPPPAATPLLPPVPGVPQLPVQLPLPPIGIQIGNPLNPPAVRQEATFSEHPKIKSKYLNPDDPSFFPPIQEAPPGLLPPIIPGGIIPPLPELPPLLPSIPGLPLFPPESKKPKKPNKLATESQVTDEKIAQPRFFAPVGVLPPNPLLPPPSVLPPNPFLPPRSLLPPNPLLPPPSVVSPNPLQPPTSTPSLTPSTPSLTPSPPSLFPPLFQSPPPSAQPPVPLLPSPSFPTPIPRFPFQPTPLFPGVPPAATSTKKSSP